MLAAASHNAGSRAGIKDRNRTHWLESVDSSLMQGRSAEMTASLLKILQKAETLDAAATRTSASLSCSSRTNAGTSSVLGRAPATVLTDSSEVVYRATYVPLFPNPKM